MTQVNPLVAIGLVLNLIGWEKGQVAEQITGEVKQNKAIPRYFWHLFENCSSTESCVNKKFRKPWKFRKSTNKPKPKK